jgi:hypothetical protein
MKKREQKQKLQKLSYISLMTITIAMTGIFFLTSIVLPSNAQNTSTNSIDLDSVKSLLDQAVEAFNNGDTTVAL